MHCDKQVNPQSMYLQWVRLHQTLFTDIYIIVSTSNCCSKFIWKFKTAFHQQIWKHREIVWQPLKQTNDHLIVVFWWNFSVDFVTTQRLVLCFPAPISCCDCVCIDSLTKYKTFAKCLTTIVKQYNSKVKGWKKNWKQ